MKYQSPAQDSHHFSYERNVKEKYVKEKHVKEKHVKEKHVRSVIYN